MTPANGESSGRPRVILAGGGHTHVLLLDRWARRPCGELELLLISETSRMPYSGMLAGHVAGYYDFGEMHIDLRALCARAGVPFREDKVCGLDLAENRVLLASGERVPFDLISLNVGGRPELSKVEGAETYAVGAKPVETFLRAWEGVLAAHAEGRSPADVVVVGGGPGGVELVLAMQARLGRIPRIHLVHRDREVLTGHHWMARRTVERLLRDRGIRLHLQEEVVAVEAEAVRCASGLRLASDATFWVTQVQPEPWVAASGLAVDKSGFPQVGETLRSVSHPQVMAVGDVAVMVEHPRPRSGVFAIRQAKPLYRNLVALARGREGKRYRPQKTALALIGTATGSAVASRRWLVWKSRWLWKLKVWIDCRFMRRFRSLEGGTETTEGTETTGGTEN